MNDKYLKEALEYYSVEEVQNIEKEMENCPEHIFSEEFECKMDKFIQETDRKFVSNGKRSFRKISVIAAVALMLFSMVGFSPIGKAFLEYWKGMFQNETFGNIAMGLGRAAYDGENVYFLAHDGAENVLYTYNVATEQVETMYLQDDTPVRASLYVHEEYIYYGNSGENGGLTRISKDGEISEQVINHGEGFQQIFIDDKNAYILEAVEGGLFEQSLEDGSEKELFSNVLGYFVDDENVYVIARENDVPYLFIAEKASMMFEKQNLSFTPISIYVEDGELYLAKQEDYQIVRVCDGKEKELPIYGTYYQVAEDKIVYLDAMTYEDSCYDLMSYDMVTEESYEISQKVFDFAVFGDEFIYLQCDTVPDAEFYLYDFQNMMRKNLLE